MKKNQIITYCIVAVVFLFTSCEKEVTTEDNSRITYFVDITLSGNEVVTIPQGEEYVEPGFTATEEGKDVSDDVQVIGEVDSDSIALYTLVYEAVNEDGYEATATRNVIVYDPDAPEDDLSGSYTASITRIDLAGDFPNESYEELTVSINKLAPGFFYSSDLIGGFYAQGRAYGSGYAATGYFKLNNDYSIELISSLFPIWGETLDGIIDGTYDDGSGVLEYTAQMFGRYDVEVTLTPAE